MESRKRWLDFWPGGVAAIGARPSLPDASVEVASSQVKRSLVMRRVPGKTDGHSGMDPSASGSASIPAGLARAGQQNGAYSLGDNGERGDLPEVGGRRDRLILKMLPTHRTAALTRS